MVTHKVINRIGLQVGRLALRKRKGQLSLESWIALVEAGRIKKDI